MGRPKVKISLDRKYFIKLKKDLVGAGEFQKAEILARAVEKMIHEGVLTEKDKLPVGDFAKLIGVSRTTIAAAYRKLAEKSLIASDYNRPYRILPRVPPGFVRGETFDISELLIRENLQRQLHHYGPDESFMDPEIIPFFSAKKGVLVARRFWMVRGPTDATFRRAALESIYIKDLELNKLWPGKPDASIEQLVAQIIGKDVSSSESIIRAGYLLKSEAAIFHFPENPPAIEALDSRLKKEVLEKNRNPPVLIVTRRGIVGSELIFGQRIVVNTNVLAMRLNGPPQMDFLPQPKR